MPKHAELAHANTCLIAYRHLQRIQPEAILTIHDLLDAAWTPERIGAAAARLSGDYVGGLFLCAAEHVQQKRCPDA